MVIATVPRRKVHDCRCSPSKQATQDMDNLQKVGKAYVVELHPKLQRVPNEMASLNK